MTVVSAAVPVGGALITPLLGIAVHSFGWRWAAFFASVLFLVAGVPLCIGIKRSPESVGMAADGAPIRNGKIEGANEKDLNKQEPEITARKVFRSPIFWNLICSMTCRSVAFTTLRLLAFLAIAADVNKPNLRLTHALLHALRGF